ncbi:MAG: alpha/beta hydrolase [Erysipelotrichaceae bacterium]|nr:alpha/beta hydrolase [Erysipelotrichaceae bacterium]
MEKEKVTKKKSKKRWIIPLSIVDGLIFTFGTLFLASTFHTQMVLGFIQKAVYGDQPINSYRPLYEPHNGVKDNGEYLISEIKYDEKYPNSFLGITYPDEHVNEDRPTLFYFHGGGFFAGSKNMADPMAASDATALIDDICAQGFNVVNVDYALVPEYRFPVPVTQANQAMEYIDKHKDEYHLNMEKIIVMGQSAGAIITSQLGGVISNPDYADLLGIAPSVDSSKIKALVIDDAPLDYRSLNLATKYIVGNYVKGSIYLNDDEISKYNNILHVDRNYPFSIELAGEYRHDMLELSKALTDQGTNHLLIDPYTETKKQQPHCFVSLERTDKTAKKAFDEMISSLKEKCGI